MTKLLEDNVGNDDYVSEESARENFEEVWVWCGNSMTSPCVPHTADRADPLADAAAEGHRMACLAH